MEVRVKKSFVKELLKCPKSIQNSVRKLIETLEKANTLEDADIDYIFLSGQRKNENYIRIRIGSFRIGAEFIEPDIIMITIGSRGDVYKFPS